MVINSVLPPTSFQSVLNGQWYIVTTDPNLGWVKVDRKYEWNELSKMWKGREFKPKQAEINKSLNKPKLFFKVNGSKGNQYNITFDSGKWSCSCPAFGWGRGRECKHIKEVKSQPVGNQ
jgi:hypothetical protein